MRIDDREIAIEINTFLYGFGIYFIGAIENNKIGQLIIDVLRIADDRIYGRFNVFVQRTDEIYLHEPLQNIIDAAIIFDGRLLFGGLKK